MKITDEAVEAAANAISEASGMRFAWPGSRVEDLEPEDLKYALAEARAALEAAATHMLADTWRQGYERGYEDGHCEKDGVLFPEATNPYRAAK